MKKIILLLFTILSLCANATLEKLYVYVKCDGHDPVSIYDPGLAVGQDDNRYDLFPCRKICGSCKLEFRIGDNTGSDWIAYHNPNSILNALSSTGNFIDVQGTKVIRDGLTYMSFDLTNLKKNTKLYIFVDFKSSLGAISDKVVKLYCLEITDPNSKDNITLDSRQICKGDCLPIGSLISPNDNVDITSFGCGANPLVPSGGMGWTTLHANEECFNEVGYFPICAIVKDACGEKKINGVIEVIDCPETSNCQACCTYIQNNGIGIAVTGYGQNSIYHLSGQLGSQTPCGMGYFEITFADGSKITSNDNTVGPFPQKVSKVCYKIPGCYECAPACLYVE